MNKALTIAMSLFAWSLIGCPESGTSMKSEPSNPAMISGLAHVDKVVTTTLEVGPGIDKVTAEGTLPDSCTKIDKVSMERKGNHFKVTITTARPANKMCAQMISPFQQSISFEDVGSEKGRYTVEVNGVSGSFEVR